MEKTDLTYEQYSRLIEAIFKILAEKGPSETTMDYLAKNLTISKRTLYEIFGSKDKMLKSVFQHLHSENSKKIERLVRSSSNVIEAMVKVLSFQEKSMTGLNAKFFIDMDTRYSHLRRDYESNAKSSSTYIEQAISVGIRQGLFLPDVNYRIIIPMIRVQLESLKRMEELFPPQITLADAYKEIGLSLLRSIATEKGRAILDEMNKRTPNNSI